MCCFWIIVIFRVVSVTPVCVRSHHTSLVLILFSLSHHVPKCFLPYISPCLQNCMILQGKGHKITCLFLHPVLLRLTSELVSFLKILLKSVKCVLWCNISQYCYYMGLSPSPTSVQFEWKIKLIEFHFMHFKLWAQSGTLHYFLSLKSCKIWLAQCEVML